MKKTYLLLAALALVGALATACGSSGTTGTTAAASSTTSTATAGPTLTIANMAFGQPLTVAAGTQITIVNNDSVEHSVTSDTAGTFDVEVDGGEHKTLTAPSRPGDYPFHCKYHPSMKSALTVT